MLWDPVGACLHPDPLLSSDNRAYVQAMVSPRAPPITAQHSSSLDLTLRAAVVTLHPLRLTPTSSWLPTGPQGLHHTVPQEGVSGQEGAPNPFRLLWICCTE